jgi:protein-S-isoprenylcysteine O-methyltransferase Ste14
MLDIIIIVLSGAGFIGFLALDIPLLRQFAFGRILLTLIAVGALTTAILLTLNDGSTLGISSNVQWIGIVLLILGGGLTSYSTLIEIPLAMQRDPQADHSSIYQKGTYALCRHPGFLWLIVDLTGVVILANHLSTLVMAISWVVLNFAVILVQDRIIFPRQFPAYRHYQHTTPFLLPTPTSLRALFRTTQLSTKE